MTKPGDYRLSNGNRKKSIPPRQHRSVIRRIEMELNQMRNLPLWDRMERDSNEQTEGTQRREDLHRVNQNNQKHHEGTAKNNPGQAATEGRKVHHRKYQTKFQQVQMIR